MAAMGVQHEYEGWRGRRVLDGEDRFVGTLEEVYLDESGRPTRWAVLDTGVGAQPRSFVPLSGARLDGGDVRIGHPRERVLAAAAEVEPAGELTAAEEDRLEHLYGLDLGGGELVRSEERLRIRTAVRAAERVRVRKVVVTEQVTMTVTVRREEVRLEPIAGEVALADIEATALDRTGEPVFEVVLHEEVPVVEMRVVPRERVRVRRAIVTEQRPVTEQVRIEQVELEQDGGIR